MSLALDPFPPAELLTQEVLRQVMVDLKGRVYSSVPSRPDYPFLTIRRVGGIPAVRERLDRASLQIDVWGNNKTEALDVAHRARVELLSMSGTSYLKADGWPVDAYVTGVEDELGLSFLEDHVTGKDRYLFGVAVYLHSL